MDKYTVNYLTWYLPGRNHEKFQPGQATPSEYEARVLTTRLISFLDTWPVRSSITHSVALVLGAMKVQCRYNGCCDAFCHWFPTCNGDTERWQLHNATGSKLLSAIQLLWATKRCFTLSSISVPTYFSKAIHPAIFSINKSRWSQRLIWNRTSNNEKLVHGYRLGESGELM